MKLTINHDEKSHRFFCTLDKLECSVDYETENTEPCTINIYRTFVHPELRGKGIAESLLKTVSNYAMEKGFKILPTCSYAVKYFQRHREYASVLSPSVDLENGGSCSLPLA